MSQRHLGLFDTPPSRRDIGLAVAFVASLCFAFVLIMPFTRVRVGEIVAFVPVVDAAMFVGDMIIATLLYAQASMFRSRALTLLAAGFVFMGLLLIPHALTMPGAFAPNGLFGDGANGTAWVMIVRRMTFPAVVIGYALLKQADQAAWSSGDQPSLRGAYWIGGAVALAGLWTVTAIGETHLLPKIFESRSEARIDNLTITNLVSIAALLAAMAILYRRQSSVLDVWLQVALAGWLIQSALNLIIESRFTVGFYALFLVMFLSHLAVMLALIAEASRLYARLALFVETREHEFEKVLSSMDSIAGVIAHEVLQPLTAVGLNAKAGMDWLNREPPNPERANSSLQAAMEAGRGAVGVIRNIRATFAEGAEAFSSFSLNDLLRESAGILDDELSEKVTLDLRLADFTPMVRAHRAQLQRVLIALLTHAAGNSAIAFGETRRVAVYTTRRGRHVRLDVADTGINTQPEDIEHIFEPFFATRPQGDGLGLSLSRTIVEAHGGRLWATTPGDGSLVFHLQLPTSPGDARVRSPALSREAGPTAASLGQADSETRLRLALEAGRLAVWQTDLSDGLVHGPELNALLGYPLDMRLTPDDVRTRYLPGELERIRSVTRALLESGQRNAELEYRIRRVDGEIRWLLMRGQLARNAQGEPRGLIGVAMDITDRKDAEERAAQAAAERESDREARLMSMDAVAAAIAHEVGQPLTAVMLHTKVAMDSLSRSPPKTERALSALQVATEAAQRTSEVIKSMRGTFKGKRALSKVQLNDLVRETATSMERALTLHSVLLELDLDETVPPVRANRVQVQRVIVNLMGNAIESVAAIKSRARRISVRTALLGREVRVDIADSGGGISPADIDRIFQPFFTTKSNGTGLGLSLSRTIAEDHNGRLWVSAGEDGGAVFHLQMPVDGARKS